MSEEKKQSVLNSKWTNFSFSPDGLNILVNTNSDNMFIFDGFDSNIDPILISERKNEAGLPLGSCFSNDGKFVFASNEDHDIQIYDRKSAELMTTLHGHISPVLNVLCNPKYDLIASSCWNTVLWLRQ